MRVNVDGSIGELFAANRERRLEAMNLQVIENNPLDAADVAMFEMFEREGWDDERCRAYILLKHQLQRSDRT